jgi:acylphosphatase
MGVETAGNGTEASVYAAPVNVGGIGRTVGLGVRILSPRPASSSLPQGFGMPVQARRIVVHGRVQGVGFRYFVRNIGTRLGLTGNVSNLPDSTVEIIVEGNPTRIVEFIREVQEGPSLARVDRLEIQDLPGGGSYSTFQLEGW